MTLCISHRQTSYWDFSGPEETVRVHFLQKQEQSFVSPDCDSFRVVSEHPVLLDYQEAWTSVYLASAAIRPDAVLEDLAAAISSLVAPWRSSESYFNDLVDPLELLRDGSGLLIRAPQSIADRVTAVLDAAGVRYSSIPSQLSQAPMQALIAGVNFVVARQFNVARA